MFYASYNYICNHNELKIYRYEEKSFDANTYSWNIANKQLCKQKGITEKLIAKSMDEIDEQDYLDSVNKIYHDYYSKQKGLKDYQKKSKTIKHLMSKGYEYDLIMEVSDVGS